MLKTWDIFDTLIARRCIFPKIVFQIVEEKSAARGFTQARLLAEPNVIRRMNAIGGNPYKFNIDDIYEEFFALTTGTTPQLCDLLKKLECETEIEQAIPITENILQVKSGDVLISDMYLPENVIRKMLEKCGLLVPVEIVITNNGKSSGRIFKQLADQNEFVFHIGDNEISDIKNPREFGLESSLSVLSNLNEVEKYLIQRDFEFASYLREIRLRNPYHEDIKRIYWTFFTINLGILIIFVQLIDRLQKKYHYEYLGFCGRDTYYLWQLYKKFKNDNNEIVPPNDYLHYSRRVIERSENDVIAYYSSRINNRKALLIDFGGTRRTLDRLRDKMSTKYSILMCSYYSSMDHSGKIKWTDFDDQQNLIDYGINNFRFTNNYSFALEVLNRATHNTPIKLNAVNIGDKIIPDVVFNEVNDTENLDVFLSCMKEVMTTRTIYGGGKSVNDLLENLNHLITITQTIRPIFSGRHDLEHNVNMKYKLNPYLNRS